MELLTRAEHTPLEFLARHSRGDWGEVLLQQFSTPPALAYIAARLLNPSATDIVLEPSAGTGSLAIWSRAIGARAVCNEISPRRRLLLDQILRFEIHCVDAEFIHDLLDPGIRPTAVLIDKTGPTPGNNWEQRLSNINWGEADNLESLWESLRDLAGREKDKTDERDSEDPASKTLFVPYTPARLKGGKSHPAPIVESASMAAVLPPEITYRPHLSREIVTEGRLSDIQLERVIYAGQRHEQRLPDGSLAGYYVDDGTGVGKGRILAGVILDNFKQQRSRALWLSANNDLLESARRDLNDLGVEITLARINDYPADNETTFPEGVIFSSYASL